MKAARPSLAAALPALAFIGLVACSKTHIDSVAPQRGAPGEEFTITGTNLHNLDPPPAVAPLLSRCGEISLEVVQWYPDSVRVRIPQGVPAGLYGVVAFGPPQGAYQRARTNAIPFWVTAAHVDDTVTDPYEVQVRSFAARYAKDSAWISWMLANASRYAAVFQAAHSVPCPLPISVTYQNPVAYNPPWTSEAEHMTALDQMADPAYPGYQFDFRFGPDPSAYAHATLGIPTNNSYQSGNNIYLYYETIFPHEFGHVLRLMHHYDTVDAIGAGQHFPPGESGCTMDRTTNQFCSACRTALNIPLDVDDGAAISAASQAILSRYPPHP